MISAVIVDDENLAQLNIKDALSDYPNWQIQGQFNSAKALFDDLHRIKMDVVFLDINMPHKSGLEIASELLTLPNPPLIAFVTAYDEFALQAFELYAIDYLLKPFDNQRFEQTVKRLELMLRVPQHPQKHVHAFLAKQPLDKLIINSTGSVRVISMQDIYWFGTYGNYVEVHHKQGCHLHRGSLSQLEAHLDLEHFCRVHRQAIVKINAARELKSLTETKNVLVLSNGDEVSVSDTFKQAFVKKWVS